jgi:hypothetical protein
MSQENVEIVGAAPIQRHRCRETPLSSAVPEGISSSTNRVRRESPMKKHLLALALLSPTASAAPGTPVYDASGTYAPSCNTDVCLGGVNT